MSQQLSNKLHDSRNWRVLFYDLESFSVTFLLLQGYRCVHLIMFNLGGSYYVAME